MYILHTLIGCIHTTTYKRRIQNWQERALHIQQRRDHGLVTEYGNPEPTSEMARVGGQEKPRQENGVHENGRSRTNSLHNNDNQHGAANGNSNGNGISTAATTTTTMSANNNGDDKTTPNNKGNSDHHRQLAAHVEKHKKKKKNKDDLSDSDSDESLGSVKTTGSLNSEKQAFLENVAMLKRTNKKAHWQFYRYYHISYTIRKTYALLMALPWEATLDLIIEHSITSNTLHQIWVRCLIA
ncbi:hypothetical protein RFI_38931, partial [Reticulomyxa filosa]